jgi:hypothetical protein
MTAMLFDSRIFVLAKDPEHPQEYQDAYGVDAQRGMAVVADGVSSAIFSAQWAAILAEGVIADPPDPGNPEAFAHWLGRQRELWAGRIETGGLSWFQRAKLPSGAFSTLLWVGVAPLEDAHSGTFGGWRLGAYAIGDSCLFHVRGKELVRTFPIQNAAELQIDPIVLGSMDLGRDQFVQFLNLDEICYPDDLLVLCTDAVADWAFRRYEAGDPPDWDAYWNLPVEDWQAEVLWLRHERHMRYDDATLVLLNIGGPRVLAASADAGAEPEEAVPVAEPAEAEPIEAEPAAAEAADSPWDFLAEAKKLKSVSERYAEDAERASEQIMRGVKSLKDKALQKFRDKFGKKK